MTFSLRHITLHGHDVGYRLAGEGPAVVLVHGLAGSSTTWREVMPVLAEHYTVLAPDLLGHGESAKPRGDYSLGAYASGIRDLMAALGVERASFVGHSLGGGVAMQLAYQFPERCERLALVASGGLGKEVTPLLRAIALPGAELVLPIVLSPHIRRGLEAVTGPFARAGVRFDPTTREVWRSYGTLATRRGRLAFINTVRAVIDMSGQRVSATDRLYLAAGIPTLIVWGDRDAIIPVDHAYRAHQAIPGSRLEVLPGAGHFLPWQDADRFVPILTDFLAHAAPATATEADFRAMLLAAGDLAPPIDPQPEGDPARDQDERESRSSDVA